MSADQSASDEPIVTRDRVRIAVQAALRVAQAEGWTDPQLEAQSGVPARAIKSYRVEGKEIPLSAALSLAVVIGPRALNSILNIIGYVARPVDESNTLDLNGLVASGLTQFSTIATCAADGRIDHLEAPLVRKAADDLIAIVMPLSTNGEAA